jgi:hypothetical protein
MTLDPAAAQRVKDKRGRGERITGEYRAGVVFGFRVRVRGAVSVRVQCRPGVAGWPVVRPARQGEASTAVACPCAPLRLIACARSPDCLRLCATAPALPANVQNRLTYSLDGQEVRRLGQKEGRESGALPARALSSLLTLKWGQNGLLMPFLGVKWEIYAALGVF